MVRAHREHRRRDADVDDFGGGTLMVRRGRPPDPLAVLGADRMPGARLWLYTNFHCNLACDYCCVASSPQTPRRELGADRIARLVHEAADWGVRELFLTGGEPFLLPDIGTIVRGCVARCPPPCSPTEWCSAAGADARSKSMPRGDWRCRSASTRRPRTCTTAHRGAGSWAKAVAGIRLALVLGFPRPGRRDRRRARSGRTEPRSTSSSTSSASRATIRWSGPIARRASQPRGGHSPASRSCPR